MNIEDVERVTAWSALLTAQHKIRRTVEAIDEYDVSIGDIDKAMKLKPIRKKLIDLWVEIDGKYSDLL